MNQPELTLAQGLQLFFVKKRLTDRHTRGLLVAQRRGDEFFGQWSRIVRDHADEQEFPRTVPVPADFPKRTTATGEEADLTPSARPGPQHPEPQPGETRLGLDFAHPAYHDMLGNPDFAGILQLLRDPLLGELMQIEYPAGASAFAAVVQRVMPEGLIREAIARQLNKKPDELSSDDYAGLTELDLHGLEITDLSPLKGLTSLRGLDLHDTQITDVGPLKGLTSLELLYLSGTQITDVDPLKGLTSVQGLDLSGTQITDVDPLKGLTSLKELYLSGTQITDVDPLKGLTSLRGLDLSATPVSGDKLRSLQEALPKLRILR